MIAAVIFDLDGVLVDSETLSCQATADLLTERGIAMDEPEVRRRFLGRPIAAVVEHAQTLGRELEPEFGDLKERLYIERARGRLRAFPGVLTVLERLHVPRAIASSGSPGKVAFSLAETGLAPLFDVVCTSTEVARGKPAPDLFLLAARKLGVDPRACIVVEDAVPGIQAASAAHAVPVGITTTHDRETLQRAGALHVIDAIEELLALPEMAP